MGFVYVRALVAVIVAMALTVRGERAAGEPASNQAVARRQDGVFFGLGGLDARSMPFDLDAFFEHAAPTRMSRKSSPRSATSAKSTFVAAAPPPTTTTRAVVAADQDRFDFREDVPPRRPVTAPSRFAPPPPPPPARTGSRRHPGDSALPGRRPVVPQPRPQPFDDDRGLGRDTHSSATLQQRFSPQAPSRHSLPDHVSTEDLASEELPLPVRRPLVPVRERRPETVPTETDSKQRVAQHVPFRPSLTSRTSPRFPTTQDSVSSATLPDDRATSFDTAPRFSQASLPVRRPTSGTGHSQFREEAPSRVQSQPRPDSYEEYDDARRPLDSEEFQDDHFDADPRGASQDPAEPFFTSDKNTGRRAPHRRPQQPAPSGQYDYDQEGPADVGDGHHSQEDIFDGPSQRSPPQDVAEEVNDFDEPQHRQQFFSPQSQDVSGQRRPQLTSAFKAPEEPISHQPALPVTSQAKRPTFQERFPPRAPARPESFDLPAHRPFVHRTTSEAPQPLLSHRGVSGVIPTSQLKKPELLASTSSSGRVGESRFSLPPRPRPGLPIRSSAPSPQFNFPATTDATITAAKARHWEAPPRPSSGGEAHFSEVPVHPVRSSVQRPQPTEDDDYVDDEDDDFTVTQSLVDKETDRVLTRIPTHHKNAAAAQTTAAVTPQFYPGNAEYSGQLSASFARATEPTRFEPETERPATAFASRLQTVASLRGRSQSRAPAYMIEQLMKQKASLERRLQLQQPQQQHRSRPTQSSLQIQDQRDSELPFHSPPSFIDDSTPFQPLSRDRYSKPSPSADSDFTFRRPSSSLPETDTAPKAPRKQLPITVSRGSKRRPIAFSGFTTPTQFATENAIDDVSLQDPISSRGRSGVDPSIQDSKVSAAVTPGQVATACNPSVCHLPNCFCGGNQIQPGNLKPEDIPQIIVLTFDDAVNDLNWKLYTRLFFQDRKNPNGCPILATFYVSHEWTDYSKVQNLYAAGHEIASHSISHGDGRDYSKKKWYNEIYGQKEILNVYANVKLDDVKGMRSPFLAMGGDKQFSMLYETNFTYDTSMTVTDVHPPYWPYTLDYAMPHRCAIPPCPKLTYPGFWEIPMVALTDLNGGKCSMADSCSFATTEDGIYEMLMKNFKRHYTSNRAPFGMYYHASWFLVPHRQEGFVKFLDEVLKQDDVYFVTALQMIDWVKHPTPLSKIKHFEPWQCQKLDRPAPCGRPRSCELRFKGDVRYMSTCNTCPNVYPWVGDTGITKHLHTISS